MTNLVENGDQVSVHYRGTLHDGNEFDSSYNRGQTLEFEVGSGQMIKGFDTAVVGMTVGETKSVLIESENAYGDLNPEAVQVFSKESFPSDFSFEIGSFVEARSTDGQSMPARIAKVEDSNVSVDFNHPLAGQDLNFEIHLVRLDKHQTA